MTGEEVRRNQIEIMGFELGSYYNSLYNEIIWLHYKWSEFEELYGTKESRIQLINQSAPFFFFIVQKVLWENILLGIARITDPTKSKGKKNITIQALPVLIHDEHLKNKIEISIKIILEKTKFCRDWRNRWISHHDYELSINENVKPLENANRLLVRESLEEIESLINILLKEYFQSTLMLKVIKSSNGSLALLQVLRDGLKEREDNFKRISTKRLEIDDIYPKEI
jgi:AbiU2